jgi:hypothetical protein
MTAHFRANTAGKDDEKRADNNEVVARIPDNICVLTIVVITSNMSW